MTWHQRPTDPDDLLDLLEALDPATAPPDAHDSLDAWADTLAATGEGTPLLPGWPAEVDALAVRLSVRPPAHRAHLALRRGEDAGVAAIVDDVAHAFVAGRLDDSWRRVLDVVRTSTAWPDALLRAISTGPCHVHPDAVTLPLPDVALVPLLLGMPPEPLSDALATRARSLLPQLGDRPDVAERIAIAALLADPGADVDAWLTGASALESDGIHRLHRALDTLPPERRRAIARFDGTVASLHVLLPTQLVGLQLAFEEPATTDAVAALATLPPRALPAVAAAWDRADTATRELLTRVALRLVARDVDREEADHVLAIVPSDPQRTGEQLVDIARRCAPERARQLVLDAFREPVSQLGDALPLLDVVDDALATDLLAEGLAWHPDQIAARHLPALRALVARLSVTDDAIGLAIDEAATTRVLLAAGAEVEASLDLHLAAAHLADPDLPTVPTEVGGRTVALPLDLETDPSLAALRRVVREAAKGLTSGDAGADDDGLAR
jgi:hypothetical protein